MSVLLQILDVIGSDASPLTVTVNGTAVCLAGENITVQVVLVPVDFGSPPLVMPAPVTPVGGAIGLNEWAAIFPGMPPIPDSGPVISSERCMLRVTLTAGSYFSSLSSLLPVSYSTFTVARMRSAPTTGAKVEISRCVNSCSSPSFGSSELPAPTD